jgi:hypothetical protein
MRKFYAAIFALSFSLAHAQWTNGGTQVSFSPDYNQRAFVSAASKGSGYVVWSAMDTTSLGLSKVKLCSLDSNGVLRAGWTSGGITVSPAGNHYAPQILTSEDDGVIVVWYGFATGDSASQVYAQKYSSVGVTQWNSGNPVKVSVGSANHHQYPIIVSDQRKGVFIAWNRYDYNRTPSSTDVLLQHIDSTGNVASGWPAGGTGVATLAGTREYYPRLVLTPDLSSVYVAYAQGLIGNTSMQLNKIDVATATFASGWSSTPLTLSPGPNVYPEISHDVALYSDNTNSAVVLWLEARTSANGELYMQNVNSSRSIQLTANGQQLAGNTANGIDYLEVKQDKNQDLLIAFNNLETFNDVAVMKVKTNGTVFFNYNPVTSGGKSAYPKAIPNGKKGMYVFYVNTNTPNKLYALDVDSTGTLVSGWTVPGSLFGSINNYDGFNPNYDFHVMETVSGEAMIAWNRKIGSLFTVYACNLLPDGSVCHQNNVGIHEYNSVQDFVLYPNPATNRITISGSEKYYFTLYDMAGKLLEDKDLSGETRLDLSDYSRGMYFYRISSNGESRTGKLVLQ